MAVLRNGVKLAVRVARARKAEGCFLENSDIPWGQQVAVMFQIVSTMALELPSILGELEELRGMYNYDLNRGGMITMMALIVSAKYLTGRRLICMT